MHSLAWSTHLHKIRQFRKRIIVEDDKETLLNGIHPLLDLGGS